MQTDLAVPHAAAASEGELFNKVLGPAWPGLHADIRRRFDQNPAPGAPLRYQGVLDTLYCSWFGRLLAHATMPMLGGALIPYCGTDVPVDIEVYSQAGDSAIYKQRIYRLQGRPPIRFTSFMRQSARGEVLEYVGRGLGMRLLLSVDQGNLHFQSDGYFWQILGRRVPIPALLTPGKTFLWHNNLDADRFGIRIEIRHRLAGTTFVQVGVFQETGARA